MLSSLEHRQVLESILEIDPKNKLALSELGQEPESSPSGEPAIVSESKEDALPSPAIAIAEDSLAGDVGDPLADKLLLFATLIPIYWITRYPMQQYEIPWWGNLPLWVAVLLVGREVLMTVFRQVAKLGVGEDPGEEMVPQAGVGQTPLVLDGGARKALQYGAGEESRH